MGLFSSPNHLTAVRSKTRADQSVAADPTASAWVSANAGTGKTHVLTMRVHIPIWRLSIFKEFFRLAKGKGNIEKHET